jgi:hypothetical protein
MARELDPAQEDKAEQAPHVQAVRGRIEADVDAPEPFVEVRSELVARRRVDDQLARGKIFQKGVRVATHGPAIIAFRSARVTRPPIMDRAWLQRSARPGRPAVPP